ncbi:MAG: hypothetical protein ACO1RT_07020, partial [Planctomycetaceae bacterium]
MFSQIRSVVLWSVFAHGPLVALADSAAEISVLPSSFALHGAAAQQRISVVSLSESGLPSAALAADEVTLESSDPGVARIEGQHILAVSDG